MDTTLNISGFSGALVLFSASETTNKGAWGKLAEAVQECVNNGENRESVEGKIKLAEDEFKQVNNVTALPSTWRSAKAVALKAIEAGISLIDPETGEILGKTAVERETAGKSSKTDFEKALESALRIVKLYPNLDGEQQAAIRETLGF